MAQVTPEAEKPDEWTIMASNAEDASLSGKDDEIPTEASAYAKQLKDQRNEIRKKELEDTLASFALNPKAEARKNKKPFVCCCAGLRRYFGICYFKNLHEAVVDGDGSLIISAFLRRLSVPSHRGGFSAGLLRRQTVKRTWTARLARR